MIRRLDPLREITHAFGELIGLGNQEAAQEDAQAQAQEDAEEDALAAPRARVVVGSTRRMKP
jgi:hypothetical protein